MLINVLWCGVMVTDRATVIYATMVAPQLCTQHLVYLLLRHNDANIVGENAIHGNVKNSGNKTIYLTIQFGKAYECLKLKLLCRHHINTCTCFIPFRTSEAKY